MTWNSQLIGTHRFAMSDKVYVESLAAVHTVLAVASGSGSYCLAKLDKFISPVAKFCAITVDIAIVTPQVVSSGGLHFNDPSDQGHVPIYIYILVTVAMMIVLLTLATVDSPDDFPDDSPATFHSFI